MKKAKPDELRPEYHLEDFGRGIRGKYSKVYRSGTNLVLLKPDVAAAFPTEKAVNDALRSLMDVAHPALDLKKRSSRRAKTACGRAWIFRGIETY